MNKILRTGALIFLLAAFLFGCTQKEAPAPQTEETPPQQQTSKPDKDVIHTDTFHKENGFCTVKFTIKGGIVPSIKRALPDTEDFAESISAQLVNALKWDLDQRRDIRKGDVGRLVYKQTNDRFKVRVYGVEYHSKRFEKVYRYFFFWERDKKFPEYFTESGSAVAKRMKFCPLAKYDEIISLYRADSSRNNSVKFRVVSGTEVTMPFPAVVERINWAMDEDGLGVEVKYPGTGMSAQFVHLSAISSDVEPGATVSVGSVFARTGVSGNTKVPHLEYRLFKEEGSETKHVDPFEFHGEEPYVLSPSEYRDFVSVKYQILSKFKDVPMESEADETAKVPLKAESAD